MTKLAKTHHHLNAPLNGTAKQCNQLAKRVGEIDILREGKRIESEDNIPGLV